jgi:hypothetical protein
MVIDPVELEGASTIKDGLTTRSEMSDGTPYPTPGGTSRITKSLLLGTTPDNSGAYISEASNNYSVHGS